MEDDLVILSESLANPTVNLLAPSVWFQSLADGMRGAIPLSDEVARNGAHREETSARGYFRAPLA